jgi:hypothetical protein
MKDVASAGRNVGAKIVRRLAGLHKPIVRHARRAERLGEQAADAALELRVLREIGQAASGSRPIVVGPWLSEVGYEILYWIPFLRWFKDRYRVDADRMVAVSRGGVAQWYSDVTTRYVELLDLMPPATFAARNEARRAGDEAGGHKQLAPGGLDDELIGLARNRLALGEFSVLHPSLMYRLFRQFWFGNRALDVVTAHTRFAPVRVARLSDLPALPTRFTAVKFYTGAAIPDSSDHRAMLREIVTRLAREGPVVLLDAAMALDEHEDYAFAGLPNVIGLRGALTPQNNLAVQTQAIAAAAAYVGTCGSLAWLAPMCGVPTVAVYAEDRFLASHLYVARHAYRQTGAADFSVLDLHAAARLGALDPRPAPITS